MIKHSPKLGEFVVGTSLVGLAVAESRSSAAIEWAGTDTRYTSRELLRSVMVVQARDAGIGLDEMNAKGSLFKRF